jgi:hypothetical protein
MDTPREIRDLVDQLGQALVHAISTDKEGQKLVEQIHEAGFDIGIMLEATLLLHQKTPDDIDIDSLMGRAGFEGRKFHRPLFDPRKPKGFEWSEEDKALMCNFRISLD